MTELLDVLACEILALRSENAALLRRIVVLEAGVATRAQAAEIAREVARDVVEASDDRGRRRRIVDGRGSVVSLQVAS